MTLFRFVAVLITVVLVGWFFWPRDASRDSSPPPVNVNGQLPKASGSPSPEGQPSAASPSAKNAPRSTGGSGAASLGVKPAAPAVAYVSPIANDLNSPANTITGDLEILNRVFEDWRANHPQEGNPVGENADITAVLTQPDDRGFVHISPQHVAVNSGGELCDRWGTPFRFHQVSGQHMEIRSAGPDRKFGTNDDAIGSPAP